MVKRRKRKPFDERLNENQCLLYAQRPTNKNSLVFGFSNLRAFLLLLFVPYSFSWFSDDWLVIALKKSLRTTAHVHVMHSTRKMYTLFCTPLGLLYGVVYQNVKYYESQFLCIERCSINIEFSSLCVSVWCKTKQ